MQLHLDFFNTERIQLHAAGAGQHKKSCSDTPGAQLMSYAPGLFVRPSLTAAPARTKILTVRMNKVGKKAASKRGRYRVRHKCRQVVGQKSHRWQWQSLKKKKKADPSHLNCLCFNNDITVPLIMKLLTNFICHNDSPYSRTSSEDEHDLAFWQLHKLFS